MKREDASATEEEGAGGLCAQNSRNNDQQQHWNVSLQSLIVSPFVPSIAVR